MEAILNRALVPVIKTMKEALGPDVSKVRIAVAGGMYMQHRKLRETNDADIFLSLPPELTNKELRRNMLRVNKSSTENMEKNCGVTWRDPLTRTIVPIDLVDGIKAGYMPVGKILAELAENEVPYAESHEVIKMKILSAHERDDPIKGIRDFDDIMALIKAGDKVEYIAEEKEKFQEALGKFVNTYLEREQEWTFEEWLKNTKLE